MAVVPCIYGRDCVFFGGRLIALGGMGLQAFLFYCFVVCDGSVLLIARSGTLALAGVFGTTR